MINVIVLALLFVTETSQEYFSLLLQCYQHCSLQAHHVYCTLKRPRNGCFHVVLTWNTRGVSVGFALSLFTIDCFKQNCAIYFSQFQSCSYTVIIEILPCGIEFFIKNSINWPKFIVWLLLLREILDNMCILIVC